METCIIEGCENKREARGWCKKHYEKWWRNGDPFAGFEKKHKDGEGYINQDGYRIMETNGTRKREHVAIIEQALGHPIPKKAETHHVDGKRSHNVNSNLVLCNSRAYHMLLEIRTRAYRACGHAGWRKCQYCQQYDKQENMYAHPSESRFRHRACFNEYRMTRKRNIHEETTMQTRTK